MRRRPRRRGPSRRATVAAADAADTVVRMRERVAALAGDEVALRAEADGLAVEAQQVAREVAEVPRLSDSGRAAPGTSLAEIDEWGARAHAALFVVRGGLESEREKVVLEAHALAAAALGEQTAGASVALVRRRLEESLAQDVAAPGYGKLGSSGRRSSEPPLRQPSGRR